MSGRDAFIHAITLGDEKTVSDLVSSQTIPLTVLKEMFALSIVHGQRAISSHIFSTMWKRSDFSSIPYEPENIHAGYMTVLLDLRGSNSGIGSLICTSLRQAVLRNQLSVIGIFIDAKTRSFDTILNEIVYDAVAFHKPEMVNLLLTHPGTNPSAFPCLATACEAKFTEVAKILINHPHIDVNRYNQDGNTPLDIVCAQHIKGEESELLQCLLDHPNIAIKRSMYTSALTNDDKLFNLFLQHRKFDTESDPIYVIHYLAENSDIEPSHRLRRINEITTRCLFI